MLKQTCQTLSKLVKIGLKLINLIIISILTAAILTSTTPQPAEENIGPTTCKLCHKTFKKSINLQLHMEKVHEINSKPLGTDHPYITSPLLRGVRNLRFLFTSSAYYIYASQFP